MNPFTTDELSLAVQIGNVRNVLSQAILELTQYGKTEVDAERLVNANISRSWMLSRPWYNAAWNAISARAQLAELEAQERENEQLAERENRVGALRSCPFVVGDRVMHKSRGSAKNGADARVGTVKRIYTVEKRTAQAWVRVVKVSLALFVSHGY